jgi:hypothetical protein
MIIGTNMTQDDYAKLEQAAAGERQDGYGFISDAEAILRINREFGFEAGRIEILHEAEIDTTLSGSPYVQYAKVGRKPVYNASDWNYTRFNVHTNSGVRYYEMINSDLHFVRI